MASLYIHIPYCKQKCTYCDFHFKIKQNDKDKMLKCIQKEIKNRKNYLNGQELSSIYFGGGTPSILQAKEIRNIIETIKTYYKIKNNCEITLECNPDDIIKEKVLDLNKIGINRLSIGIQSFNDSDLVFMNRSHNASEALECIKIAKETGFDNITIDLIYGLPKQNLNKWEKNLDILFDLNIPHFSSYALTVEKKTALKYLVDTGKVTLPSEEGIVNQFNLLIKKSIENNYIHYEISNFGKHGYYSKHNTAYWKNKYYLGIGPSAHSFNGFSRRWNVYSNKKYINNILSNRSYYNTEILSTNQQYNEAVFTSLRTMWGINTKTIKHRFGDQFLTHINKEIIKWIKKEYIAEVDGHYILTQSGKSFADSITSDLFVI